MFGFITKGEKNRARPPVTEMRFVLSEYVSKSYALTRRFYSSTVNKSTNEEAEIFK